MPVGKAIVLINFLLFFMIAWLAGQLTSTILEGYLFSSSEIQVIPFQPDEVLERDKAHFFNEFKQPIVFNNIFRTKERPKAVAPPKPVAIEQPREPVVVEPKIEASEQAKRELDAIVQKLELKGTAIFGPKPFAFIYEKSKRKQKEHRVGEKVFETEAVVLRMDSKKVILGLKGAEQSLEIPQKGLDGKEQKKPGVIKAASSTLRRPTQPTRRTPIASNTNRRSPNSRTATSRQPNSRKSVSTKRESPSKKSNYKVDQIRENEFRFDPKEINRAMSDPKVLNSARVVPHIVSGETVGFKITLIDKGSIFDQLGLQNNDILKVINGEMLNSMEKGLRLYTVLKNEREVILEVDRGGSMMSLTYHME